MVCAKRHQAKKVQRHKSGSGTEVIMGLEEFSKPDRKSNHSPYGKRESMKIIRRKGAREDILLKNTTQHTHTQAYNSK